DIEGELKKCKRYMEAIIKKYTDRDGFIPYRDTCDFSLEMQEVLEKARETKNILLSLDIAFLLLKEAVEAYQYSDDSDGYIGSLVTETIEFIREIVIDSEALSTDIREKIFNKMLTESDSRVFEGWDDYRIDLLRLCIEFTDIEELRNKLKMKINSNIDKNSGDKYGEYYVEGLKQILFELVNDFGTQEDTEEFIKENLKYSSFREMLIGKLIIEGKFQEVVVVAYEGEVKDKDYAGLVSKWRKMRYEAYKRLGLVEEQANLAKELFFDGDFEYYQELKELTKEDKKVFYNNLKLELKNSKDWHVRRIYLKLITEEKDLDAILEHAKGNTSSIEEYAEMLQEKYKDEVIEIYEKHIKASADAASNRSAYKRVCGILRGYKKIAGVDNQVNLINQLMALHKKRPAFIDELSKIK
ncbi:MAG: hypothetical protein KGZ81_12520, partial [Flavobacteriales bacterium]|nr:hypothetical protein [Flavobacteriales bacterium]